MLRLQIPLRARLQFAREAGVDNRSGVHDLEHEIIVLSASQAVKIERALQELEKRGNEKNTAKVPKEEIFEGLPSSTHARSTKTLTIRPPAE